VQTKGNGDFERRNEICLDLIRLAKKGNKDAEYELMDLMSFLADKWTERIPAFHIYKYHKETRNEIMRRCIYNYRKNGPFVGYVHVSLEKAAAGLERKRDVSHENRDLDSAEDE